jgi:predicted nuclease of predicted toxin-antitoxin system
MNFVADESLDFPIILTLRKNKHFVFSIAEKSPGIDDEEVLKIAYNSKSILLTQDKDFGELVFRLQKAHYGIVLFRLSGIDPYTKAKLCLNVITDFAEKIPCSFTVVYKDFVKIRMS